MLLNSQYSVLAFSGGMDSTSLLLNLLKNNQSVHAISFNYGQKHIVELERASKNIEYLINNGFKDKIVHKIFDLSDETIKGFLLPMVLTQKKSLEPIDNTMKIKNGNQITFLINKKNEEKATDWLKENGFESAPNET